MVLVKLTAQCCTEIIKLLRNSQLTELGLVRANMSEATLNLLGGQVATMPRLLSLDISWNHLVPKQLNHFLADICQNRRLQFLNLSWNSLCAHDASEKEQTRVANHLSRLVKYNRNLLHLDLTATGLTELMVQILVNSIRKAPTILSVHLG